jgi:hypothetical protein
MGTKFHNLTLLARYRLLVSNIYGLFSYTSLT